MTKILSLIGYGIISLLAKTVRIREVNGSAWRKQGANVIFAFWHGEQFIPLWHHRDQRVVIMSSLSRDGEIQAGILKLFGYVPVRGSSTRGGDRALVEMIRHVKKGSSAAFAVDGPRGPLHRVKPGVLYLAQKTGRSLVLVSAVPEKKKVLDRAWDRYEVPVPFSRAAAVYSDPIPVGKDDDIDELSRRIESGMASVSKFAHESVWSKDLIRYLDDHPRPRILIVQPSRIGDVVFTMPAVHALRKRYPRAWIGWFVDERCAPLVENHPDIDEVIIFDRRRRSAGYLMDVRRALRERQIDLSIDFHGLFKSALMVMLAGARFRIASSSTNGMRELSWLFSREVKAEKDAIHCVERHLAVARYLDCCAPERRDLLGLDAAAAATVEKILNESGVDGRGPVIAVHPGGGWTSRRWHAERFARLIDRLNEELNARVILVGGKEGGAAEKGLNEEITGQIKGKIVDLTGKLGLKELIALLRLSSAFVANEAGPMHIATALNIPAVALLGPTNAGRTGPFGGKTKIIQHTVDCQPCRNRACKSKKCMDLITVDEVFDAVKCIVKT